MFKLIKTEQQIIYIISLILFSFSQLFQFILTFNQIKTAYKGCFKSYGRVILLVLQRNISKSKVNSRRIPILKKVPNKNFSQLPEFLHER